MEDPSPRTPVKEDDDDDDDGKDEDVELEEKEEDVSVRGGKKGLGTNFLGLFLIILFLSLISILLFTDLELPPIIMKLFFLNSSAMN